MAKDLSYQFDTHYIYALVDPISKEFKYIGQTRNLKQRFDGHINSSSVYSSGNKKKHEWIAQLRELGLKPDIKIIEECTFENALKRETYHIRQYFAKGCKLLNNNNQILDLTKSTLFPIDVPNRTLYIIEELASIKGTDREKMIIEILNNYVNSLNLYEIGSEIENFDFLMNHLTK